MCRVFLKILIIPAVCNAKNKIKIPPIISKILLFSRSIWLSPPSAALRRINMNVKPMVKSSAWSKIFLFEILMFAISIPLMYAK